MMADGLVQKAGIDPVVLDLGSEDTVPPVDNYLGDSGRWEEDIAPDPVDLVHSTLNTFSCHFQALATAERRDVWS